MTAILNSHSMLVVAFGLVLAMAMQFFKPSPKRQLVYHCPDDFAAWAFGEQTWKNFTDFDLEVLDLMKAWNARHGDTLRLESHQLLVDTLPKMKEIWVNSQLRKRKLFLGTR